MAQSQKRKFDQTFMEKSSDTEATFWEKCPDDILINIFKYIDLDTRSKASRTCQRWYDLLKNPILKIDDYTTIKVDPGGIDTQYHQDVLTDVAFLLNHIGKVYELDLGHQTNPPFVSGLTRMVDDGRLKIDKINWTAWTSTDVIPPNLHQLLPTSLRELRLGFWHYQYGDRKQKFLTFDWSRFSRLERLSLICILITPRAAKDLSTLKYLDLTFSIDYDDCDFERQGGLYNGIPIDRHAKHVNALLSAIPSLEELRLTNINFNDQRFTNFLQTIKKLSKLRTLHFNHTVFHWSINFSNQNFQMESLKQIDFDYCDDYSWAEAAQFFVQKCTLETIRILTLINYVGDLEGIYRLAPLCQEKNTKLALIMNFGPLDDESIPEVESKAIPEELCTILTELTVWRLPSLNFYRNLLNGGIYEKLIKLELTDDQIDDGILEIVARVCPRLEKLNISCDKIAEISLQWFLTYWNMRRSKKLSIIGGSKMENIFGTSYEKDQGIFDDGKRWKIFRRSFDNDQYGTRLMIWEKTDTIDEVDQKILMIKSYSSYDEEGKVLMI